MSAGGPTPDQPVPPRSDGVSGPDPETPGRRPMHPSLEPTGEHVAHSAIGSLLGGVIVWGGVGLALDHWLGTGRVLTAVGVVVGSLTGFVIVYLRFGRDE
jgi:ATP synthase protein I